MRVWASAWFSPRKISKKSDQPSFCAYKIRAPHPLRPTAAALNRWVSSFPSFQGRCALRRGSGELEEYLGGRCADGKTVTGALAGVTVRLKSAPSIRVAGSAPPPAGLKARWMRCAFLGLHVFGVLFRPALMCRQLR